MAFVLKEANKSACDFSSVFKKSVDIKAKIKDYVGSGNNSNSENTNGSTNKKQSTK